MHDTGYCVVILLCSVSFSLSESAKCNQSNEVDIIYLLDASGSVGSHRFQLCIQYIAYMVDVFNIGPSATRISVGIMLRNGSVDFKIDLSSYSSKNDLKSAILSITYPSDGWELIHEALGKAEIALQTSGRWQSATSIVVVMSDGGTITSTDAAESLKSKGVSIYAAGVDVWPYDIERLLTITSGTSYFFDVFDSESIDGISGPITSAACNVGNECNSSPCVNGTCINGTWYSFRCECVPGYTGTYCEQNIDECASQPCLNGGSCIDQINAFSCACVPGYTGQICHIDIDECASSPCERGGTCNDRVNGFTCDCPPGYYGDFCETGICQPSIADIVFVLDSSVSQTETQFNKQLEFISQFIDHIVIGEKNLQVGVVTYSFKAKIEIQLGEYNDNVTLKDAVRNIKYRPGATFTDKGLEAAIKVFTQAPEKRPYGKVAKRYVYVMTDGMSNNRLETQQRADDLKSNVDKVLAIGIGTQVSHKELLTIASKDTSRDRKYVYSLQNFDALYTILKELVKLTCDECTWKTSSDIVFLLDTSSTMVLNEFQSALNAITYITDKTMKLENEDNVVRIGLVTYGAETKLQRPLNDSTPKGIFLAEIQGIVLANGYCSASKGECDVVGLDKALAFVRGSVFDSSTSTVKSDAREMIIVLTNGRNMTVMMDKIDTELDQLKTENKTIFTVALGEQADIPTLQKIAGDPALVFSLHDEADLSILDALTTEFFSSSCDLSNDF